MRWCSQEQCCSPEHAESSKAWLHELVRRECISTPGTYSQQVRRSSDPPSRTVAQTAHCPPLPWYLHMSQTQKHLVPYDQRASAEIPIDHVPQQDLVMHVPREAQCEQKHSSTKQHLLPSRWMILVNTNLLRRTYFSYGGGWTQETSMYAGSLVCFCVATR